MSFKPNLTILPPSQLHLWQELDATPEHFTLYGGTALALRLGHRASIDFDFFSNQPFDPDDLTAAVSYLKGAERIQVGANTLKCRIERSGPVLVSFFGGLGLGRVAPPEAAEGRKLLVASLLDLAGTKVAVVQKRAEAKDYLDIDALLRHGITLPTALAAGCVVYGRSFNPMIALKALSFFDDVSALPADVKKRLTTAVAAVNPADIPVLTPYTGRVDDGRIS
jgi:hypothetical protein